MEDFVTSQSGNTLRARGAVSAESASPFYLLQIITSLTRNVPVETAPTASEQSRKMEEMRFIVLLPL